MGAKTPRPAGKSTNKTARRQEVSSQAIKPKRKVLADLGFEMNGMPKADGYPTGLREVASHVQRPSSSQAPMGPVNQMMRECEGGFAIIQQL